jgi:hypothetical protein
MRHQAKPSQRAIATTLAYLLSLGVIGCSGANSGDGKSGSSTTLRAALTVAEDGDQDDIRNEDDLCPTTPAGQRTDGYGCGLVTEDADLDGVGNGRDTCPSTPAGAHVDALGCARSQGGQLPVLPANLGDTPDLFELTGWNPTSSACGESAGPRTAVDRDGDGVPDTLVVVTRLAGQNGLTATGSPPDMRLSLIRACETPLRAEVSIRFVDMLVPGFVRADPSTWAFATVPAARLDHSSDFMFGTRFDVTSLSLTGTSAVAFNSGHRIFSHTDGVSEIRVFTDYTENLLDNLRIFVQPPNTRFGANVTAVLDNGRVNFQEVITPGNTFIASRPAPAPPALPSGVCGPREAGNAFVVETSAERNATAATPTQVCVKYALGCAGPPTGFRALQTVCDLSGTCTTLWRTLSMTVDTAAGLACADPDFSPFVLLGTPATDLDTVPPVIGDLTITDSALLPSGDSFIAFSVPVSDDEDLSPLIGCDPPSGSVFPPAGRWVRCTAKDASGNTASRGFLVILAAPDTTAPVFDPVIIHPPTGSIVTFAVTARDDQDPNPIVACLPPSGSVFPVGATTVRCVATDSSGNVAELRFTITVPPGGAGDGGASADGGAPPDAAGPDAIGSPCIPSSCIPFACGSAACLTSCGSDADCAPSFVCMAGACIVTPTSCTMGSECPSGFCVDSFCCSSACGGGDPNDCQACSISAGGTTNGTCTPLTTAPVCYDANLCDSTQGDLRCQNDSLTCPAATPWPAGSCGDVGAGPQTFDRLGGQDEAGGVTVTVHAPGSPGGQLAVQGPGEFAPEDDPNRCPPASGFAVVESGDDQTGQFWNIDTSEGWTATPATVCVHYSPDPDWVVDGFDECELELFHGQDTAEGACTPNDVGWRSINLGGRTAICPTSGFRCSAIPGGTPGAACEANTICGMVTDHFSPFAVFAPLPGVVPTVTVPANMVVAATSTAGATVSFAASAVDPIDGPLTPVCTPASGSLFPIGLSPVTCTATNRRGITDSAIFTVSVQYQAPTDGSFFLFPIRPDGSSLFRIGRPVPVRFRLTGASAGIKNLTATLTVQKISDGVQGTVEGSSDETVDDTDLTFKYRPLLRFYAYRWKTRGETKGTYRLRADLGDGVNHVINVSLR